MSIYSPHFVLVSLGDTLQHVFNMRAHSPDRGKLLLGTEPFFNFQQPGVYHTDVESQVFEATFERASGPLNGDHSGLGVDSDPFWDFNCLVRHNLLHDTKMHNNLD